MLRRHAEWSKYSKILCFWSKLLKNAKSGIFGCFRSKIGCWPIGNIFIFIKKCPKIARNRQFLVFFEVFEWHSDILDSMKKWLLIGWMLNFSFIWYFFVPTNHVIWPLQPISSLFNLIYCLFVSSSYNHPKGIMVGQNILWHFRFYFLYFFFGPKPLSDPINEKTKFNWLFLRGIHRYH